MQTNIARIALIITLMLTLGVSGLLTMKFAIWARSTIQPGAQPSPTPLLLPSPSPEDPYGQTGPLPQNLSQEIANLRSQNRLLYNGNTFLPEIALTFDDGPNPYYTPQILNILQKYHVKATFFCIGRLIAAYPALVRQEYAAGYTIGNHSWSHPKLA